MSIPVGLQSGPHSRSAPPAGPCMARCGAEIFEFYLRWSGFSVGGFFRSWRKGAATKQRSSQGLGSKVFAVSDAKSGGREIGN